jgi:SAM-dependent methyltransferase
MGSLVPRKQVGQVTNPWWQTFFDADYLRLARGVIHPDRTQREVDGLWKVLGLREGSRVLDAPCGYGRISRPLAERGVFVLGVDQSKVQIECALRDGAGISAEQLRYVCRDLRQPLPESGFDAAINVFSSLGYGSEEDDLAILRTLREAVRPGGLVFVETCHRDAVAARMARGVRPVNRLPDGTLVLEEAHFDPIAGRVETRWYWAGPNGIGEKSASLRTYTATELSALMKRAGLRVRSALRGCSEDLFDVQRGEGLCERLGLLGERVARPHLVRQFEGTPLRAESMEAS